MFKVSERREQDTAWVSPAPHNNPSQVRLCKHQFVLKLHIDLLSFFVGGLWNSNNKTLVDIRFHIDFSSVIELKPVPCWLFLWFATGYFTFTFPVRNKTFVVHSHLHFCSWIASRHFLNKRQPKLQARDSGIWWAWRFNVNYRFCGNTSRKLKIARMKLI